MKLLIFSICGHIWNSQVDVYNSYIKQFGENTNFSHRRNNCCVRMSLPTWLHCQTLNHSMGIIGYSDSWPLTWNIQVFGLDTTWFTTCRFFLDHCKNTSNRRNQFSLYINGVLSLFLPQKSLNFACKRCFEWLKQSIALEFFETMEAWIPWGQWGILGRKTVANRSGNIQLVGLKNWKNMDFFWESTIFMQSKVIKSWLKKNATIPPTKYLWNFPILPTSRSQTDADPVCVDLSGWMQQFSSRKVDATGCNWPFCSGKLGKINILNPQSQGGLVQIRLSFSIGSFVAWYNDDI